MSVTLLKNSVYSGNLDRDSVDNLHNLDRANKDELTASDNSMGNSGGTTEVRIRTQLSTNLYRLRFGSALPENTKYGVSTEKII